MITEERRQLMHARQKVESFLVNPVKELLDASAAFHKIETARADAMREGIKICLDAERERRKDLKPGAPATTYTEARIAMLESLLA